MSKVIEGKQAIFPQNIGGFDGNMNSIGGKCAPYAPEMPNNTVSLQGMANARELYIQRLQEKVSELQELAGRQADIILKLHGRLCDLVETEEEPSKPKGVL